MDSTIGKVVHFRYHDTDRIVFVNNHDDIYLEGIDLLDDAFKKFRIDRMQDELVVADYWEVPLPSPEAVSEIIKLYSKVSPIQHHFVVNDNILLLIKPRPARIPRMTYILDEMGEISSVKLTNGRGGFIQFGFEGQYENGRPIIGWGFDKIPVELKPAIEKFFAPA